MNFWSLSKAKKKEGKIAIVTGANAGIGYETTKGLASVGVEVIMACRDLQKAETAKQKILKSLPEAKLTLMEIDLASLASVRAFAKSFKSQYNKLDMLVNNAGVMMTPFQKTEDGLELQMEVNYFGHFLLTGLLIPVLEKSFRSRVVCLSSLAHRWGDIHFDNLNAEKSYDKRQFYAQSKLACLIFAYHLDKKLVKKGFDMHSYAAHPGISNTNLMRNLPGWLRFLSPLLMPLFSQSAEKGALPILRACLDDTLNGGEYIGPSGTKQYKGHPVIVDSDYNSKDKYKAKKLWKESEKIVDFEYFKDRELKKEAQAS
ncbi:oxidoreductase [Zunongwangia profunda]|jgi:NAD(P)-dependent dehydrogenase (short-subunit alcohol dehydrogenase family)|uniref:oxidoreductase n=1 Tax=Zunongwangia profunda TaxID=398743 RepID=UPI001D18E121|nr:oxidoreductase [Zunongwangia profunda]MCC4229375.1 SDR family NAD(P)-dependent oxidoreductase [Zunongwangia profunda]